MNIAIYGAGSTGCYLGGLLTLAGHQVTLIARQRVRDEIIAKQGLTLTDYEGMQEHVMPHSIITQLGNEAFDLVLVTLKCHQLESGVKDFETLTGAGSDLIFMQNGLGSLDNIRSALPKAKVFQGITPFNVLSKPGAHFHRGTEGILIFEDCENTRQMAESLSSVGVPCELHQDIKPVVYGKLLLNLNNALNAISNQPIKTQLENRSLRKVLAQAMREWLLVAQHQGVKLAQYTAVKPALLPTVLGLPDFIFGLVAKKMLSIDPEARSSMWEDIQAGRPTEIDYINGAVVREAEKVGLDAPVNKAICAAIKNHKQERSDALDELVQLAP